MIFRPDIEHLIRPKLKAMNAYSPIEPTDVLSKRTDVPEDELVKLDGNENPYGCSPRVASALANYVYYHIYPDPGQQELRKALGAYTGLGVEHIVAGSGSDELIDLVLRLCIQPGDEVINCPPTFGMYPFSTEICDGKVINIARKEAFAIDVAAIKKALKEQTRVIFIASPNNPTGNITPESQVMELLDSGAIVVIDEAYSEFSGVTLAPLVPDCSNLIVLRTFSKWAGLAGLRIGYGVFPANIASYLMKIKQPYNVNAAAQVAALESLKDIDYLRGTVELLIEERARLIDRLGEFDWLKTYPSQANFVLCSVLKGEARQVYRKLQREGIFIRYFDTSVLRDCLRISVGKPEHTDRLITALRKIGDSEVK